MIKKALSLVFLLSAAAIAVGQQATATPTPTKTEPPAKTAPPAAPHTNLKVGQPAPDFSLRATDGKTYKLSDFKGKKNVVLAFYVLAFTGG